MANVRIRKARPDDVPAIMKLLKVANMHYIPSPEMADLDWHYYFVAMDGDRLAGFSGYKVLSDVRAKTQLMVVDPAYRRHGIGYRLHERRLRAMARKGIRKVITNADRPETIEWYKEHFGCREIGKLRKVHEFGDPGIQWWTTLEMDVAEWIAGQA